MINRKAKSGKRKANGRVQTLGEFIHYLAGEFPGKTFLQWPPDVFAVVGSILERTGAYVVVMTKEWPPARRGRKGVGSSNWPQAVRKLGRAWRTAVDSGGTPPKRIVTLWSQLRRAQKSSLHELNLATRCALLELCAAADEACAGIGMPGPRVQGATRTFDLQVKMLLIERKELGQPSTLCRAIDSSKALVLPKMHTPQSGINFRSLTHHLALCHRTEVVARWHMISQEHLRHSLNLLIVPWPKCIIPAQFSAHNAPENQLNHIPSGYGFFDYSSIPFRGWEESSYSPCAIDSPTGSPDANSETWRQKFRQLLVESRHQVGRVDAVIFPEMSLLPEEFEMARQVLVEEKMQRTFLIGGVYSPGQHGWSINSAVSYFPLLLKTPEGDKVIPVLVNQPKHHRWKLEASQIKQYSLGSLLDINKQWWEACAIEQRRLSFYAIKDWLSFCVLICEDLARQDPISDMVRSVGPNLVIALLQDGPQLATRWPARYATVFADDPGSSVLTLTSLGMARLSRAIGKPESRVVALWKDYTRTNPVEIELPPRADGVILSLSGVQQEEFTADGRSDHGAAGYLTLTGIMPIILP